MRAEGSRVCLQWAEEPEIIGSCQRCVVLADPVDRDVIRATLEETKGANERTTKGPWESMAGGLGQGSGEERENTSTTCWLWRKLVITSSTLQRSPRGFGPAEKFSCRLLWHSSVQALQMFHFTVDVPTKHLFLKTGFFGFVAILKGSD